MDFPFSEYGRMADLMRTVKGKVLVSINDDPAIREVIVGFTMMPLQIGHSIGRECRWRAHHQEPGGRRGRTARLSCSSRLEALRFVGSSHPFHVVNQRYLVTLPHWGGHSEVIKAKG